MEDKSDCGLCHDFTFHIRPASHALIQYQSPGPPYHFLLLFFSFGRLFRTTMVICLPRITVCHAQGGWWTDRKTRSKTWITWLNFTAKKNITVAEKRKKGRHQSQCRAPSRGLGNLDRQRDRMGWDKGLRWAGLGPEGNSVARLYKMARLFSRNICKIVLL